MFTPRDIVKCMTLRDISKINDNRRVLREDISKRSPKMQGEEATHEDTKRKRQQCTL